MSLTTPQETGFGCGYFYTALLGGAPVLRVDPMSLLY